MRGPIRNPTSPSVTRFPDKAADLEQAFQTLAVPALELLEPVLDQDPVLAPQGRDVGDRPDGDELQTGSKEALVFPGLAAAGEESLDELVSDADAGQAAIGIARAFENGIEHGQGLGEGRTGKVVVGDDDIDPEVPGPADESLGLDAAVHADDEPGAPLDGDGDPLFLQAVSVLEPLGDEIVRFGPELPQPFEEHDRGQDAVGVVIAEDEDGLAGRDRGEDALDGLVHPGHQKGVVEVVERPVEKEPGALGVGDPAISQDAGDRLGDAGRGGQGGDVRSGRGDFPNRLIHLRQFIMELGGQCN